MAQTIIQGEYYFRKQEMVAGFNFSPDGKFQFFYSYGAVDRSATGTFLVKADKLQIQSDKLPGKDVTIKNQSKQGSGYNIQFEDPNKYLLKDILCIFFVDGKQKEAWSDENGKVEVAFAHCDSICVQHPFYPDIMTFIKDSKSDNNNFTLTLNPSLVQVSFKGIIFKIANDKVITCLPNYFMPLENIEFLKQ